MRSRSCQRGFSLIETMVALLIVAIAMTGLVVTFVGSGKFGVLSRRQANAVTVARSLASQLSHADYADLRLANTNTANDINFADPNGVFASDTVPTGADAPDSTLGPVTVGNETFTAYVNVSPQVDPNVAGLEMGRYIAVIVTYHVGRANMRAVVIAYRYNPAAVGVGQIPL